MGEQRADRNSGRPPWWLWYMPSGEAVLKAYVVVLLVGSLLAMAGILFRWP